MCEQYKSCSYDYHAQRDIDRQTLKYLASWLWSKAARLRCENLLPVVPGKDLFMRYVPQRFCMHHEAMLTGQQRYNRQNISLRNHVGQTVYKWSASLTTLRKMATKVLHHNYRLRNPGKNIFHRESNVNGCLINTGWGLILN